MVAKLNNIFTKKSSGGHQAKKRRQEEKTNGGKVHLRTGLKLCR
jgi:hypothetical protein